MGEAKIFAHKIAGNHKGVKRFDSVMKLTGELFGKTKKLVYIAPCGVVVRAVAPHLKDKYSDPAVVVVDVGGRHAVSLLSGHEGGANALALEVANAIHAEPVISTTTEAEKNLIVGVGCRKGAKAEDLVAAVSGALEKVGAGIGEVRWIVSAELKSGEPGLIAAAEMLGVGLRFISHREIILTARKFGRSKFVEEKVRLPAVAEPCALLGGKRTELILCKTILRGATVAIAKENCL